MIVRHTEVLRLLLGLALLTSQTQAASRQSFCKCVCGSNSTIIPLDGKPLDPPARKHIPSISSSLLHSSSTTSTSSSTSLAADSLLPEGAAAGPNGIFDSADQGYDVTDYGGNVQRRAEDWLDAEDDSNDAAGTTKIMDPLAHAHTADLADFGHDKASSTSISRSGTASNSAASATATVEDDLSNPGNSTDTQLVSPQRAGTCNDCNRQFCLKHPDFDKMCGEAKEEEVFTTCFQRDSAKDQLVVYTFIIVTVGLLGYAAVRPWLSKRYEASRERRSYSAVPTSQVPG